MLIVSVVLHGGGYLVVGDGADSGRPSLAGDDESDWLARAFWHAFSHLRNFRRTCFCITSSARLLASRCFRDSPVG